VRGDEIPQGRSPKKEGRADSKEKRERKKKNNNGGGKRDRTDFFLKLLGKKKNASSFEKTQRGNDFDEKGKKKSYDILRVIQALALAASYAQGNEGGEKGRGGVRKAKGGGRHKALPQRNIQEGQIWQSQGRWCDPGTRLGTLGKKQRRRG